MLELTSKLEDRELERIMKIKRKAVQNQNFKLGKMRKSKGSSEEKGKCLGNSLDRGQDHCRSLEVNLIRV